MLKRKRAVKTEKEKELHKNTEYSKITKSKKDKRITERLATNGKFIVRTNNL